MADELVRLSTFESRAAAEVKIYPVGVTTIPLNTEGNSLLSTLWAKTVPSGATVTVRFWEFGPGSGSDPSERIDLAQHTVYNNGNSPDSERIIVNRIHNKPKIEITVTGSPVEIGIYISVITQFAVDFGEVMKKQAQMADLLADKGLVAMGYDATLSKYYFLPMEDGALKVTGSLTSESGGVPVLLQDAGSSVSTPGSVQTLISDTVPVSKVWRIRKARINCRFTGAYEIIIDGDRVGAGNTGHDEQNSEFAWETFTEATAGQVVEVKFRAIAASPAADVSAFLHVTEQAV